MKKKKLSYQKVFNLVSLVFLLTCCLFYGGRFVKYYLANKEKVVIEENTLAKSLKDNSSGSLKSINDYSYLNGKVENNYVLYSGILWRAIKIDKNNAVTLVSNNSLTSLAMGENTEYVKSYVNKWLNDNNSDYSGILESNLNSKISYLKKNDLCTDVIDDVKEITCNSVNNDYYVTTLSINDYINTGASDGFINTLEYFYLYNQNKDNETWYVNSDGKIDKNDGTDIYGVKAVITLKENINLVSGTGSKDDPYVFETSFGLFGSYVKLDNDIWRVTSVNDDNVKLVLDNYIMNDSKEFSHKYSNNNSNFDDTKNGTLGYYLNKTYLNSLSYKDKIIESDYSNGYYGVENDFDYTKTLDKKINTKVALVSIGDIIFNNELDDYFTSTSSAKKNNYVYTIKKDAMPYSKMVSNGSYIVPVVTINKDILSGGTGTKNDPLRMVSENE